MALRTCKLCSSPYGEDVVKAKELGVKGKKLFKKWAPKVEYVGTEDSFYMMLYRHVKDNHYIPPPTPVVPQASELTLEEYSKKLMESAMMDPEMFTGKKISHQAIIAAQRALIEKDKVKVQNDAMKMAFIAFFRGNAKQVGGEVIDGLITSDSE